MALYHHLLFTGKCENRKHVCAGKAHRKVQAPIPRFAEPVHSSDTQPLLQVYLRSIGLNFVEATKAIATGWRSSLLGWRPSLLGWRPSLLGWRPSLLDWRPSLLGWRPSLQGWKPFLIVPFTPPVRPHSFPPHFFQQTVGHNL